MNDFFGKIRNLIKSIKCLNIGDDYLLTQAGLHVAFTWALTLSFGMFNFLLAGVGFFYVLWKEFILDGWYKKIRQGQVEGIKDLYTDLLTNYIGFVIAIIILKIKAGI